jgi:hypothetical protein
VAMITEPTIAGVFTGFQLCAELVARRVCFRVRRYQEGDHFVLHHQHVPLHRTSECRRHEVLRSLVACHSGWRGEWIVSSLLNNRGEDPRRYPGFLHDVSYPERGVLRHTVSAGNVEAWCDLVCSPQFFRVV